MNVYYDPSALPRFRNAVVTIGSFDGVHLGHRQLLSKIKTLANQIGGEEVVVTFHPHPRSVIFPSDHELRLLTSLEEKLFLLKAAGIAHVVVVPFNVSFSQLSPRQYIENFIIKSFNPTYLVVGYDHRFGLNRQGDYTLLQQYESIGSFKLVKIEKEQLDDIAISSTKIRNYISEGNLSLANQLLDYPYIIQGTVVKGNQIGSKIGFPTANIKPIEKLKLLPKIGIYAVSAIIDEDSYHGMLYIGNRPTIADNAAISIELNIFDFNEKIYNKNIHIEFEAYVRDDVKFESLEQLAIQLEKDAVTVKSYFNKFPKTSSKEEIKIGVVILNYNGAKVLPEFMPSVFDSSLQYKVEYILIDNASTDNSLHWAQEHFSSCTYISLPHNLGFAGGYNEGLKGLNHKYYVLINSDLACTQGWLDSIIASMEANSNIAVVQPKIRSYSNPHLFEYAGAAGGFIDPMGYPYCRGRIFDKVEEDKGQYDEPIELDWASGAAFVIRSSVYWEAGGFDVDYFAHMEEIDLCLRIKKLGYNIMSSSEVVYHLGGGTLQYESPRKTFLNFRNNLATITKNYPLPSMLFVIAGRLALDGLAGLQFLAKRKPKNCLAIIKAHFSYYRNIPSLLKKRKSINSSTKQKFTPINSKFVLFKYFVSGVKKFSEL